MPIPMPMPAFAPWERDDDAFEEPGGVDEDVVMLKDGDAVAVWIRVDVVEVFVAAVDDEFAVETSSARTGTVSLFPTRKRPVCSSQHVEFLLPRHQLPSVQFETVVSRQISQKQQMAGILFNVPPVFSRNSFMQLGSAKSGSVQLSRHQIWNASFQQRPLGMQVSQLAQHMDTVPSVGLQGL
jgi:hypothetical protein